MYALLRQLATISSCRRKRTVVRHTSHITRATTATTVFVAHHLPDGQEGAQGAVSAAAFSREEWHNHLTSVARGLSSSGVLRKMPQPDKRGAGTSPSDGRSVTPFKSEDGPPTAPQFLVPPQPPPPPSLVTVVRCSPFPWRRSRTPSLPRHMDPRGRARAATLLWP